ncbi:MAG TPA: aminoacetone oxidase family FAD-binding enzyme, partial [Candidatus Acidoferrales bacterium]|nr:aminoacetone oxidase family FAD-binding enzyme [Candidatus Acidoferrales bacterium]
MHAFDIVILGAGAAGLMCAIEAGKRGRRVVVVERSERAGKKILISGGGRCNFTNLHCRPEHFLSSNPHFAKSALARYTPADFIALVEKHRIPYHEKKLGQLFCDRSAQDVVTLLEDECAQAGVRIFTGTDVREVTRDTGFHIRTGELELSAPALVVATGGLSIPKMGATSFGYDLARQFGHSIRACRPGLVPLTFDAKDRQGYCDLAGVSVEVEARCGTASFRENMLITHRGLSGPAILQASSYWKEDAVVGAQPAALTGARPRALTIDLAPGREWTASLRDPHARRDSDAARAALRALLPQRLADRWLELHPPEDWTNRSLNRLDEELHNWQVTPAGTEGYEKAEVTVGGVDTGELSGKTMESRIVP